MTILPQPWVPTTHTPFFRIPDGERPFERFRYGIKIPLAVGLALGWSYHISRHPDFHNAKTTGKMLYTAFPFVGLGFFYCGGTFIAGHLRKKDDEFNHVIGVLTAAPLVRKFLDFRATFIVVTYTALFMAFFKHTAMENKTKSYQPLTKKAVGGYDWYIWSQSKPADAGYLTYSLFK
ncbi:hypothetical protein ANTQUA_LOCUS782 [Anthophora quadrimaculata]